MDALEQIACSMSNMRNDTAEAEVRKSQACVIGINGLTTGY